MGMALAAIANHCDNLVLDQSKVTVSVIEHAHFFSPDGLIGGKTMQPVVDLPGVKSVFLPSGQSKLSAFGLYQMRKPLKAWD
jgi:hypothetical protein